MPNVSFSITEQIVQMESIILRGIYGQYRQVVASGNCNPVAIKNLEAGFDEYLGTNLRGRRGGRLGALYNMRDNGMTGTVDAINRQARTAYQAARHLPINDQIRIMEQLAFRLCSLEHAYPDLASQQTIAAHLEFLLGEPKSQLGGYLGDLYTQRTKSPTIHNPSVTPTVEANGTNVTPFDAMKFTGTESLRTKPKNRTCRGKKYKEKQAKEAKSNTQQNNGRKKDKKQRTA